MGQIRTARVALSLGFEVLIGTALSPKLGQIEEVGWLS
jgi:hypothetical protein